MTVQFCACMAEVIDGKHQGPCPLAAPRDWWCGRCDGSILGAPCTCPSDDAGVLG